MISLIRYVPRYACVGFACAAFNNILLIGLDASGFHYATSVIVSALVMTPVGFYLQTRYTFSSEPYFQRFWRYAALLLLNPPLSWALLWVIHDYGELPMIWAAPTITLLLFMWNYFASSWTLNRPIRAPRVIRREDPIKSNYWKPFALLRRY